MKALTLLGPLTVLCLSCSLVGCVDALDDAGDEPAGDEPAVDESAGEPADEPADDDIFYETVVRFAADGTATISEPRAITAGEERRQNEMRAAIEAGTLPVSSLDAYQDIGCSVVSLWLYSGQNLTGSRICFHGSGGPSSAWLGDYTRFIYLNGRPQPVGDWRIRSGSYWPGEEHGLLRDSFFGGPTWELLWTAYGPATNFNQPSGAYQVLLSFNQ